MVGIWMAVLKMQAESERYNSAVVEFKQGNIELALSILEELTIRGAPSGPFGIALIQRENKTAVAPTYFELINESARRGHPEAIYFRDAYLFKLEKIGLTTFACSCLKQVTRVFYRRLWLRFDFNHFDK
jgi:hypothetical protein